VINRPQIRAVLLDGGQVVDGAGRSVGRLVAVHLDGRTVDPAYVTVTCALCDGVAVVPLSRARLLDGCVQVPYTAGEVCGAPRADGSAGQFDARGTDELDRYYARLDGGAPDGVARGAGGSAFRKAEPRRGPVAGNGHRRTNGPTLVSLPAIAGLDVHAGDDAPAAYPATPLRPWPPVATSSAGPPWWQRRQWRWPSVPAAVRLMRPELRTLLDLSRLPHERIDDLILAACEAAANAVEHARLPALPYFDVLSEVGEGWARIVVQDHGGWRAPTVGGDRGRGLQMMGVLADATLTVGARGTTVVLRSRTGGPAEGRAPSAAAGGGT
jgi:anti-sigma regulatory factor (Ser/Thr protein kinase)